MLCGDFLHIVVFAHTELEKSKMVCSELDINLDHLRFVVSSCNHSGSKFTACLVGTWLGCRIRISTNTTLPAIAILKWLLLNDFFFICWLVYSTKYRRYLDYSILMSGGFHKPSSSGKDTAPLYQSFIYFHLLKMPHKNMINILPDYRPKKRENIFVKMTYRYLFGPKSQTNLTEMNYYAPIISSETS